MRSVIVLLGIGLTLLLAAWVVGTPPFGAPDEASHYLRALNIAQGHLLGRKISYPNVTITPTAQAFVNHDTRAVHVPARLSPPDVLCVEGRPDVRGSCAEASPTGDYYPPAYLLPAVALKIASTANRALWASRFLSAALCLAFILLASALLWGGSLISLIGLLAALTPMVLFVSSILNPSGLETAASIALAAAALRIGREPARARGWVWAALMLCGVVTALSFQAGPAFLIFDLLVAAAVLGGAGLRELNRRPLVVTALVLGAALVVWFAYARYSGASHSHFGITPIRASLHAGVLQLGHVLRDAVGSFGSLTIRLPLAAQAIWWGIVLALAAGALCVGTRGERLAMGFVLVLALAFPVLAYAWVYRYSGFGMQGRQVLPVLVLIPLAAGEQLHRHRTRLNAPRARAALRAAVGLIAVFQAYAWWYDAHHAAGAPSRLLFWTHASWSPPLGWVPWAIAAALGALSLLAVAARSAIVDAP